MVDDFSLIEEPEETQASPGGPEVQTAAKRPLPNLSLLNGNLGLLVMFAAGIGAIYLLSLRTGPAAASAESKSAEVQVDDALTRLSKGDPHNLKASTVVSTFYLQARQRQIPLDELRQNPFVFRMPAQAPITPGTGPEQPVVEPQPDEMAALDEVRHLRLQSVMQGSSGATAMISNNLLTEGQKIRAWTVKKIGSDQVLLTFQNHEHVLTLPR